MSVMFDSLEYTPTWAGIKRGLKVLFSALVATSLFVLADVPVPVIVPAPAGVKFHW